VTLNHSFTTKINDVSALNLRWSSGPKFKLLTTGGDDDGN